MEQAGATGETKAGRQGWLLCTVYQLNNGATRWAPRPLVSLLGNEQASLTVRTGRVLQTQRPGFWEGLS